MDPLADDGEMPGALRRDAGVLVHLVRTVLGPVYPQQGEVVPREIRLGSPGTQWHDAAAMRGVTAFGGAVLIYLAAAGCGARGTSAPPAPAAPARGPGALATHITIEHTGAVT